MNLVIPATPHYGGGYYGRPIPPPIVVPSSFHPVVVGTNACPYPQCHPALPYGYGGYPAPQMPYYGPATPAFIMSSPALSGRSSLRRRTHRRRSSRRYN